MKVLVAEDEHIQRRAMVAILRRIGQGVEVLEAADGREAVMVAKVHRPEVLLVDVRMPALDGLRALEEIRSFHPSVRAAIITAFEDFHYAREAVRLGARDYLLKPVDAEQLLELVRTMLEEAAQEASERDYVHSARKWLEEAYPLLRRQLAAQLARGEISAMEVARQAAAVGMEAAPNVALVLGMLAPWRWEPAQLRRQMIDALEEVVPPTRGIYCLLEGARAAVFLHCPDVQAALSTAAEVVSALRRRLPGELSAGLGRWCRHVGELARSLEEARRGEVVSFLRGGGPPVTPEEVSELGPPGRSREEEHRLLTALKMGRCGEALEAARIVGTVLMEEAESTSQLRLEMIHLGVLIDALMRERELPFEEESASFLRGVVEGDPSEAPEALQRLVSAAVARLKEAQGGRAFKLVEQAKAWLEANYGRRLKLSDVAQALYVSPSHLSHVFKEETGQTVLQYLTDLRIREARALLRTTDLSVGEVAQRVGFDNPSYFSRWFRRHAGTSPSDYRKGQLGE